MYFDTFDLYNFQNFCKIFCYLIFRNLSNIDTSNYEETGAAATCPTTTVNLVWTCEALRKRALMSAGNNAEQRRKQARVHVYPT